MRVQTDPANDRDRRVVVGAVFHDDGGEDEGDKPALWKDAGRNSGRDFHAERRRVRSSNRNLRRDCGFPESSRPERQDRPT